MLRALVPLTPALLLASALACGDKDGGDSAAEAYPADWESVRDDVLVQSCGFSSCHAPPGSAQFGVDNDTPEDAFINEESSVKDGAILVVPGDPDASYLVQKLEGADGIEGDSMPPGGSIDPARIQQVRDWISSLE